MTLKEFREIVGNQLLDEDLEISIPDNIYEPTGVVPINNFTEVFDGTGRVIGYVIV